MTASQKHRRLLDNPYALYRMHGLCRPPAHSEVFPVHSACHIFISQSFFPCTAYHGGFVSDLLHGPSAYSDVPPPSEPTVRLDLAPSLLNWLSRRSVLAAIHSGMLTVEPMSFSNLLQELGSQLQSCTFVSCALCGTHIVRLTAAPTHEKPSGRPLVALTRTSSANTNSWFKYPMLSSNMNQSVVSYSEHEHPENVYVFRLAVFTNSQPPPACICTFAKGSESVHTLW